MQEVIIIGKINVRDVIYFIIIYRVTYVDWIGSQLSQVVVKGNVGNNNFNNINEKKNNYNNNNNKITNKKRT